MKKPLVFLLRNSSMMSVWLICDPGFFPGNNLANLALSSVEFVKLVP